MNAIIIGLKYIFENPYYSDLRHIIQQLFLCTIIVAIKSSLMYFDISYRSIIKDVRFYIK